MPIVETDPWREQYFEGVLCPDEVYVPTDDGDCYRLFPQHRWIYNKLLVAESQGLDAGPHGLAPARFPVFSKPIYNLRGMGAGSQAFADAEQYRLGQAPSHMWMPLLTGEHVSTDVAVVDGEARWWRHVTGKALDEGTFDYWTVHAEPRPRIEEYCGAWLVQSLKGYTGIVNFETIAGTIIEVHLRMSDQWPDLYGKGWVEALVELYANGRWQYADADRRTGYSVVLFGVHGPRYQKVDSGFIAELLATPGISSVQQTFHQDRPPETHSMPPGGFRLAIVNCWDLDAGRAARDRLALRFWAAQPLRKRAKRGQAPISPSSVKDR